VAEVYKAIFAEADNSLGTLQMLTNIETQLEELLAIIDTMPRDEVEAAEKLKEKERRSRVREAKTAEAERAQEERIQRSIRRSQVGLYTILPLPIGACPGGTDPALYSALAG